MAKIPEGVADVPVRSLNLAPPPPRVTPSTVGGRLFYTAEWLATAFAWVFKVGALALATQNHLSIFEWAGGFVLVMAVAWLPLWLLRGARAWWQWVTAPARS